MVTNIQTVNEDATDSHNTVSRSARALAVSGASAFALATVLAIGGCNTVEGAGKDLESAGEAISEEASD